MYVCMLVVDRVIAITIRTYFLAHFVILYRPTVCQILVNKVV